MPCASKSLAAFEDALAGLLAGAGPLDAETAVLARAHGRVLAEPVIAPRARPCAALAAMDGYAVRADDITDMPQGLRVIGASYPGAPTRLVLAEGQAARVTTGATLPAFTDRVVVDEAVRVDAERVFLVADPGCRRHVRGPGSDFRAGDVLVQAGRTLSAAAMVAAAAGEAGLVRVVRRPKVVLLITGDEVAAPETCGLDPDKTPDSASFGVSGLIEAWGGVIAGRRACLDRPGSLRAALSDGLEDADVVAIIGGASQSERDLGRAAALDVGADMLFAGVAMKPGKPVWAARTADRYVVGLPGNPVAALVTARLLLAPLIAALGGTGANRASTWTLAATLEALSCGDGRDHFLTARLDAGGVRPLAVQRSSVHGQLSQCDALIRRRPGAAHAETGAVVEYLAI